MLGRIDKGNTMRIKSVIFGFVVTPIIIGMTGCATVPDPAEVCTAEWVKPRAERAVKDLRRDTGRTIKLLARNAEKLQNGGSFSPLRAAAMLNSLQKLVRKIETGRGVKDLKTLAATCDDPAILRDGVVGYLEDVKAPKVLMDMIRDFDFEKLTRDAQPLDEVVKS